jgi:ABC-type Fe3+-hydroxamate transport system substrate-binding protein
MIASKLIVIAIAALVVGGAVAVTLWDFDGDGDNDGGGDKKNRPDGKTNGDIVITDDRGKNIVFKEPPKRIMALGSSFTDTLVMLGCMDQIYAVDQSSVSRLSEYNLSGKEALSTGAPSTTMAEWAAVRGVDCVIVWNFQTYAAGIDAIESAKVNVVALYPRDVESVKTVISVIGKMMGKDAEASDLIGYIDSTMNDISKLSKDKAGDGYGLYKNVYIELDTVSSGAYNSASPGTTSITASMLDILGVNYISKHMSATGSKSYSVEDITVFSPDIMIFMGPRNQTDNEILRNGDIKLVSDTDIHIYRDGEGFNGNWASATPSFIKGLVYLYEVVYGETYVP